DLDGAPAAARVEVEEAASRAEERTESTRPLAVADLPRRAEGPLDGPALGGVPDVQGRGRELRHGDRWRVGVGVAGARSGQHDPRDGEGAGQRPAEPSGARRERLAW